jgi:ribosome-binding protein aMBF1 (putative translation factor)
MTTIPTLPDGIKFSTVTGRFGWNLRIARQRAGLTQRALAARMGRAQERIARWER